MRSPILIEYDYFVLKPLAFYFDGGALIYAFLGTWGLAAICAFIGIWVVGGIATGLYPGVTNKELRNPKRPSTSEMIDAIAQPMNPVDAFLTACALRRTSILIVILTVPVTILQYHWTWWVVLTFPLGVIIWAHAGYILRLFVLYAQARRHFRG